MKKILLIALIALSFLTKGFSQTEKVHYFKLTDRKVKVGEVYIILGANIKGYPMCLDLKKEKELDTLAGFLLKNKNVKIEIGCHCDYRPIPLTHDTLTKKQAVSIREYLISKGIDQNRLVAIGYGSAYPRILTEKIVHKGVEFPKGTIITEKYIKSLKTLDEKMAAFDLDRRIVIKIIATE